MSKFFIERPILANVIAIITVLLGFVCLFNLPVAQYPEVVPPTIQVSTNYPGASAEVVATTVGIPIEQGVNGVEDSIYMQSTSGSDGTYTLTVTFSVGTDLNAAIALVQNAVNGALSQLPQEVQTQGVTVQKVSTNILLIGSLYSDDNRFDETFLSNYAIINLQNPIARLPGVGQVQILGAGPYSMRIWLDPIKLKAYGLTVLEVQEAIKNQNIQVAAGQLGGPPVPSDQVFQFTVNTLGRLSDVKQFENIIIKTHPPATDQGGKPPEPGDIAQTAAIVRMKDVAKVQLSQEAYSNFSGLNGKKAAQMNVYTLPGANALKVSQEVKALMAQMSQKFPLGLKYTSLLDSSLFIQDSIHGVYAALIEAGILVLIVIMLFLQNFRAMLVPATTVPVTIIGAFAAMAVLGFTVNLMTLFALILAIGIVVDDAIVIVENTSHYIEEGMTPKDASIKAMGELTGPILGITLVLTSVFLPASFLPGITGQMFRQFALVIAATAIISALNALTLNPTQCALYIKPIPKDRKVNRFYQTFNRVYTAVEDGYVGLVHRMAQQPGRMAVVFFAVVTVAGLLFGMHPTAFLPIEDQGYCLVSAELPPGASQARVREVSADIDKVLKQTPGIKGWVTSGGVSALDAANLANVVTEYVMYEDWGKRPDDLTQAAIVASLRERLEPIRKARFDVLIPPPIPGLGQAGGFQMMVEDRVGVGLNELQKGVQEIISKASNEKALRNVTTTFSAKSPQLELEINRTMVESLGVTISDVFQTLQTYLGSTYVNLFTKFNQSFQVRLQAGADYRTQLADIGNLYVANKAGEMVPLGALLHVRRVLGSELLTRYNMYPAASVIGSPAPGYSSGQALDVMERVAQDDLPLGMGYDWTGLSYQQKLISNQSYFIFALSITLVFLVLAAQYESWTDPAAVVLSVPMALAGVIIALIVRGFPTDLYTQIGLVLMIALAAKNAILVVEFARELKAEGMATVDAAVEATRRRFRPIVMTSIAFILSVVPLLTATGAGAASQQALGTVVFGGMVASTLVAIPFVPVFYILMQDVSEWGMRRRGVVPVSCEAASQPAD
ncbi:MAG: efflux RND transporter permease subunit [Candidatus Binatus sp.]|uniref:efflux RND transporter permease subunit n=1 Tax=Candidatus Binatus sp. TaxID=2811406 RepID=UPI0027181A5C|nr:efflux RND transporter permease subunit [Candidatus Binatus sp.]MDO8432829.1 efflux RND transporter permease subunit [Candidatus Binatus sp.]